MNTEHDKELTVEQQKLIQALLARLEKVYNLEPEDARRTFFRTAFYRMLVDPKERFCNDDAETNFARLQNEIEYGAWNKNASGGIVE